MSKPDWEKLWQEHTRHEFLTRSTESTLETMVEDAYVNHVPVMTGGCGKEALRESYSRDFIPSMPPDTKLTPVSRTVDENQLVDEMIFSFTHTQEMPWMLPGIPPTNRRVRLLSPEPWLVRTTKVYSGLGADIVMESFHSLTLGGVSEERKVISLRRTVTQ